MKGHMVMLYPYVCTCSCEVVSTYSRKWHGLASDESVHVCTYPRYYNSYNKHLTG